MAKSPLKLVVNNKRRPKLRLNRFAIPRHSHGAICGNCGYSAWHIGRIYAECATPDCCMALPLGVESED
jgi:hypothetical protein